MGAVNDSALKTRGPWGEACRGHGNLPETPCSLLGFKSILGNHGAQRGKPLRESEKESESESEKSLSKIAH